MNYCYYYLVMELNLFKELLSIKGGVENDVDDIYIIWGQSAF